MRPGARHHEHDQRPGRKHFERGDGFDDQGTEKRPAEAENEKERDGRDGVDNPLHNGDKTKAESDRVGYGCNE